MMNSTRISYTWRLSQIACMILLALSSFAPWFPNYGDGNTVSPWAMLGSDATDAIGNLAYDGFTFRQTLQLGYATSAFTLGLCPVHLGVHDPQPSSNYHRPSASYHIVDHPVKWLHLVHRLGRLEGAGELGLGLLASLCHSCSHSNTTRCERKVGAQTIESDIATVILIRSRLVLVREVLIDETTLEAPPMN